MATVGELVFTAIQFKFKIGQSALYNPSLPFHLVTITLFYVRNFYPALVLLGIWVYDRQNRKRGYLCLLAMGYVIASQAFISTSRGAIVNYGLIVLFLWFLTGRFTKFRKSLVVIGFVVYLFLAPALSTLRVDRVETATGTVGATNSQTISTTNLANQQLGHFLLRVGGAGSMLFALGHEDQLSPVGLVHVFRPSGLTSYFTQDVVGIAVSSTIADSQAPTVIGMGMLIGGAAGMVVVLILTLIGFDLAWHWFARKLWSWPVALALLAQAALTFFSEGVPIELYKSLLAIAAIEFLYRRISRQPYPQQGRTDQDRLPALQPAPSPIGTSNRWTSANETSNEV